MKRFLILVASCLLLPLTSAAQLHPNLARGFAADSVYDLGDIDSVNLFNGNLNVRIPLGVEYRVGGGFSYRFTLVYNSNVWDFETREIFDGGDGEIILTRALPAAINNAGMGWRVSLGDLVPPWPNTYWSFVTPDGASHRFWDKLHYEDPYEPDVMYTRDNSYLRMKITARDSDGNPIERTVEAPTGVSYVFSLSSEGWRLSRVQDRSGNWVSIDYSQADRWTITDATGRQHTVLFQTRSSGMRVIDQVRLASFGSTVGTFDFQYTDTTIAEHCYDDDNETSSQRNVSLLSRIVLPDGGMFIMERANGALGYNTSNDAGGGTCSVPYSGTLTGLALPTGGHYEWDFGSYAYPTGSGQCGHAWDPFYDVVLGHSVGVIARRKISSSQTATWTYSRADTVSSQDTTVTTTVTSPEGDDTRHYFRVRICQDPADWTGWDYGLPFTREVSLGALFLSTEYFEGSAGAGNLKRAQYVLYEHDTLRDPGPAFYPSDEWYATNRRVRETKTVYLDDGGGWVHSVNSAFDGMGHYRFSSVSGSWSAALRSSFTDYNPVRGTYEINPDTNEHTDNYSFTSWPVGKAWILGTFTRKDTSQDGQTARVEYCFDWGHGDKGRLLRMRTVENGTARSSSDVIRKYSYDTRGNVTWEWTYGGDLGAVGTGELCSTSLGTADYSFSKTYQYGIVKTSRHGGQPYLDLDRDIDLNTGLVKTKRDITGLGVDMAYDALGRVTAFMPEEGAWTSIAYSYSPPSVHLTYRRNGGGSILAEEELLFDDFGRLIEERRKMPGDAWSKRVTQYDVMGRPWRVSEWASSSTPESGLRWTVSTAYDRWGRPGTVTAPDGGTVSFQYRGVRETRRTVKIGTSRSGDTILETPFTVTTIRDPFGRVSTVTEPIAGPANVTTTYSYDMADRLTGISIAAPEGVQTRSFSYDGRGFLEWEKLPEKGSAGNGYVRYFDYDTLGHAHRVVDGSNDLSYTYDPGERLTQVRETGSGKVLETRSYGTSNGTSPPYDRRLGRLVMAMRHNFYFGMSNPSDFIVEERYEYRGTAGRISKRRTTVSLAPNSDYQASFDQFFCWNDLGALVEMEYPRRVGASGWSSAGPRRVVRYWYDNGFLTAVPGYAESISYHSNGRVNRVTHATKVIVGSPNRLTAVHDVDPVGMQRPRRIWTFNADSNWTSGIYSYDDAGNTTKIGSDWYLYDGMSRLKQGTARLGNGTVDPQNFQYDGFGNLTNLDGRSISVNHGTNRLSGSAYDAAGNQLSWGTGVMTYQYAYYPTNQIRQITGGSPPVGRLFMYTADGERICSQADSPSDPDFGLTYTFRDLEGNVVRRFHEMDGTWTWKEDYIWGPEGLLATVSPDEGRKQYVLDHLGSPRLVCDRCAYTLAKHNYYPYGEEATYAYLDRERIKFTGQERDLGLDGQTTDDLDYLHARHFSLHLGRFLSTDPVGGSIGSSQSWNRYAYVMGNPVNAKDPDGRASDWAIGVNAFNRPEDKPEWVPARTPEQRAVELVIMGPFVAIWTLPALAAALPAEVFVASLGAGATGLVIGGVQEAGSDHPMDVRVRNTLISGGVGAVAGPAGEALSVGSGFVRSLLGKALAGLGAAYAETKLKGQEVTGATVASVTGSSTNAMIAHSIGNAVPTEFRGVGENIILMFLEIEKSNTIRDLQGDYEKNQDTPVGGVPSGQGYGQ